MPSVSENRKVIISSGVWEKTEKQRSGPAPAHNCLSGGFWWDKHISLFHPRSLGEYLDWLSCSDPSEYLQLLHTPLIVQCRTWWKVEGKCRCWGRREGSWGSTQMGKDPYLLSRTSEGLKVKLILRWSQPLILMRLLIKAAISWRVMKGMRKWGKESRKEGGRKETGKSHRAEGTPLRTDIAQSLILLERGEHTGSSCLAQGGTVPPTSPYKCLWDPPPPLLGAGFRLEVSGVQSAQSTLAGSYCWPLVSISNRLSPSNLFIYSFSLPRFP